MAILKLTGTGGRDATGTTGQEGIFVRTGAQIRSRKAVVRLSSTVLAAGGPMRFSGGIRTLGGSLITSAAGNITLTGTGGPNGLRGLEIEGEVIASGSVNTITLNGTLDASVTASGARAVSLMAGAGGAFGIQAQNGSISVNGAIIIQTTSITTVDGAISYTAARNIALNDNGSVATNQWRYYDDGQSGCNRTQWSLQWC